MVPLQKMVKILNKNGTISENGKKFLNRMEPFQAEKGQKSSTKWYHFRKRSKILNKNGTISEKGQKS